MVTYPSILSMQPAMNAFVQSYLQTIATKQSIRKQHAQELIKEYSEKYRCEYCGRSLLNKSNNCEGCGAPK